MDSFNKAYSMTELDSFYLMDLVYEWAFFNELGLFCEPCSFTEVHSFIVVGFILLISIIYCWYLHFIWWIHLITPIYSLKTIHFPIHIHPSIVHSVINRHLFSEYHSSFIFWIPFIFCTTIYVLCYNSCNEANSLNVHPFIKWRWLLHIL